MAQSNLNADIPDVDFGGFSISPLIYPISSTPPISYDGLSADGSSYAEDIETAETSQAPVPTSPVSHQLSKSQPYGSTVSAANPQSALASSSQTAIEYDLHEQQRPKFQRLPYRKFSFQAASGSVSALGRHRDTQFPEEICDTTTPATSSGGEQSHGEMMSLQYEDEHATHASYAIGHRSRYPAPIRSPTNSPHRYLVPQTLAVHETLPISPRTLPVPSSGMDRLSHPSGKTQSIRDTSRSRSNSMVVVREPVDNDELCEACQTSGPQRSYCNACRMLFCDPCWNQQVQHRTNRANRNQLLHEKTEHSVAKKVNDVFTPDLTPDERDKLHADDIDTTWFGVAREEGELPLFRDYGRYANVMTTLKDIRLQLPATPSTTLDEDETLFPSLVSFVGQTGAGKSSLIKLLIDLKLSEGDPVFQTPVVGAAGRDVSTSEDVHLYLDPDSCMSAQSRAPLLFADCEGLDGGERDPVGALLKKRMERQSRMEGNTSPGKPTPRHLSERELIWADTPKRKAREFAVAQLYPRLL